MKIIVNYNEGNNGALEFTKLNNGVVMNYGRSLPF